MHNHRCIGLEGNFCANKPKYGSLITTICGTFDEQIKSTQALDAYGLESIELPDMREALRRVRTAQF